MVLDAVAETYLLPLEGLPPVPSGRRKNAARLYQGGRSDQSNWRLRIVYGCREANDNIFPAQGKADMKEETPCVPWSQVE